MAPSIPEQPVAKKVKTEEDASPAPETEDVNAEEPNVIPGPPPQNRRGRKQSFSNDPTKQFVCRICDRRFRRQEHLKRHHRSLHTRDKPFKCDECGKTFSRSDNLAQHHRTHGSGNIPLDVAGAQFPSQSQSIQPIDAYAGLLFQVGATIPGGNGPQIVDPAFSSVPDGLPVIAAPVGADPHVGLVPI